MLYLYQRYLGYYLFLFLPLFLYLSISRISRCVELVCLFLGSLLFFLSFFYYHSLDLSVSSFVLFHSFFSVGGLEDSRGFFMLGLLELVLLVWSPRRANSVFLLSSLVFPLSPFLSPPSSISLPLPLSLLFPVSLSLSLDISRLCKTYRNMY